MFIEDGPVDPFVCSEWQFASLRQTLSVNRPLDRQALKRGTLALCRVDSDLAELVHGDGIPPMWSRQPGFATLVRILLEQQVSLASAASAYRRIQLAAGRVSPDAVMELGVEGLRRSGITRQKSRYLHGLAKRVRERSLDLGNLTFAPTEQVRESLETVKGIGRWTSDIYLLMALKRPDVWPTGDLALQLTIRAIKGAEHESTEAQQQLAKTWSPWRSVAVRILWNHYLKSKRSSSRKPIHQRSNSKT